MNLGYFPFPLLVFIICWHQITNDFKRALTCFLKASESDCPGPVGHGQDSCLRSGDAQPREPSQQVDPGEHNSAF